MLLEERRDFRLVHHLSLPLPLGATGAQVYTLSRSHAHAEGTCATTRIHPNWMIGSDQSSDDHAHTNSTITTTLSVLAKRIGTDGTLEKQRAGTTRRHDRVFRLSRPIHSRQRQTELRLIFLVPPLAWLLTSPSAAVRSAHKSQEIKLNFPPRPRTRTKTRAHTQTGRCGSPSEEIAGKHSINNNTNIL
jgi:hypothetical protein